ncbi:hypothetical protein E3N88_23129 [Mikania micrantha]|uniref:Uncharacterized protein n=1 Tax=Mikania micrantha TaxID=192012 RepID=A0A5N6NF32_9ASTR|nr:hypothetical protein E3N88_23129 [Mikania micrantha]
MIEHTKLVSQCLPWGVLHSQNLKEQTFGLSLLAIGMDQLASQCLPGVFYVDRTIVDQTFWPPSACQEGCKTLNYHYHQCPMWLSMWWDGVWVGRRLDSGVCPIHKHTELDDTCDVNEVKVVT